jgi:hypothetical protein
MNMVFIRTASSRRSQKIKKSAKIKLDLVNIFGVGGVGWRCRSFLKKNKNTAIGSFFPHFFIA